MRYFSIDPLPGTAANMCVYLHERAYEHAVQERRPCVILFPGGAYRMLAAHEAEPVALAFLNAGFQVCVLSYRIRPDDNFPFLGDTPMRQGAAAIRYVRGHAAEWFLDPQKISVCGFSAGAHAAGCTGVFWDTDHIPGNDSTGRPDAMILSYPVISGGNYAHRRSFFNLTGDREPSEANNAYSLELHVTSTTPPTFLWHTCEDETVPVENTLLMANALQASKIPMELHLYTKGSHGMSLCNPEVGSPQPHAASWFSLAVEWLDDMGLGRT